MIQRMLMRKVQKVRTLTVLAVLMGTCFGSAVIVSADEWFDSYGKLSKNDEFARFANLATYLRKNPETIGYVAFCNGPKDRNSDVMRQKSRGVDFAVTQFNISRSRFKLINYGLCAETKTILQPIDKTKPPPRFF